MNSENLNKSQENKPESPGHPNPPANPNPPGNPDGPGKPDTGPKNFPKPPKHDREVG